MKPIESLVTADLEACPVWEFSKTGETSVRPVQRLPMKNLTGKVVVTQVCLANGKRVWALVGNVDPGNVRVTEHFSTLSVLKDNSWFTLARYHDFDYSERGPEQLAVFLGMPVDEIFPISYDITPYVIGDPEALSGTIAKEPREKLTRAEIIALAVQ
jgi:hypothetical protein